MILESAVLCLALNIYHEARGESLIGQHAVAQVTMNRAGWKEGEVCHEVLKPKQFSWTNGGLVARAKGEAHLTKAGMPREEDAWYQARGVAIATLSGMVPRFTQADHYHTTKVRPTWRNAFKRVATYGSHIFYTSKISKR